MMVWKRMIKRRCHGVQLVMNSKGFESLMWWEVAALVDEGWLLERGRGNGDLRE